MDFFLSPYLAVKKPRPIRYFSECKVQCYKKMSQNKMSQQLGNYQLRVSGVLLKKKSYYVHLSTATNCYAKNTTEFLNESRSFLLKHFFCRKTVPDHLTALLIPIPRLRIPDTGSVIPDPTPFFAVYPWSHITRYDPEIRLYLSNKASWNNHACLQQATMNKLFLQHSRRIALKQCNR